MAGRQRTEVVYQSACHCGLALFCTDYFTVETKMLIQT